MIVTIVPYLKVECPHADFTPVIELLAKLFHISKISKIFQVEGLHIEIIFRNSKTCPTLSILSQPGFKKLLKQILATKKVDKMNLKIGLGPSENGGKCLYFLIELERGHHFGRKRTKWHCFTVAKPIFSFLHTGDWVPLVIVLYLCKTLLLAFSGLSEIWLIMMRHL